MVARLLFVDDEPKLLDALRRLLHPMRSEWRSSFAQGAEAALQLLAADPFDLLVTDVRMPGMSGIELLKVVAQAHPRVSRILLSGMVDQSLVTLAHAVAHQFLSKPCAPELLLRALGRGIALRTLLREPVWREVLGRLQALGSADSSRELFLQALSQDSLPVAALCRKMAESLHQPPGTSEAAFTAGLLHDLDRLCYSLENLKDPLRRPRPGATYAGAVDWLNWLWTLPAEALQCYDSTATSKTDSSQPSQLASLAAALVVYAGEAPREAPAPAAAIWSEFLPAWRGAAQQIAAGELSL